jgi:capsular exopolysaccharide synthesis family protein
MDPIGDDKSLSRTNTPPEVHASLGDGWKDRVRTRPIEINAQSPVFPFDGRDLRAAEQYRIIRTKILQYPRPLRIIAVSSPQLGDGKSVTAANVACALALKNEVSVLLIDGDLRRSALAGLFNIPASPGLTEVLCGESSLEEAIISLQIGTTTLHFLSAGRRMKNPAELLELKQLTMVCAEIRKRFDWCIIDTPPVGVVADFDLVQAVTDGVVLVARPDHTNRKRCRVALQSVPKEKLVGVITNCVPDWFLAPPRAHDYSYYRGTND